MSRYFPDGTRLKFVDLVCSGASAKGAAASFGASYTSGMKWWHESVGMTVSIGRAGGLADPFPDAGATGVRGLSLAERGMIQFGRRQGLSYAAIARETGRNKPNPSSPNSGVQESPDRSPDGRRAAEVEPG